MATYQVNCIKCKIKYENDDPDDYYCLSCLKEKNKLAKELDAKFKPSAPIINGLQKYDSLPKIHGFVNAKDLL